eukprot:5088811-Alexandrium_andersonii.AAC.1
MGSGSARPPSSGGLRRSSGLACVACGTPSSLSRSSLLTATVAPAVASVAGGVTSSPSAAVSVSAR